MGNPNNLEYVKAQFSIVGLQQDKELLFQYSRRISVTTALEVTDALGVLELGFLINVQCLKNKFNAPQNTAMPTLQHVEC